MMRFMRGMKLKDRQKNTNKLKQMLVVTVPLKKITRV